MAPWFHYWSSCLGAENRPESIRVFFLADSGTSPHGLLQPFSEEFISERTPSHLVFISTVESRAALNHMVRSEEFKFRVKGGAAVLHHPTVSHWTFVQTGEMRCALTVSGSRPALRIEDIIHDGLLEI